MKQKYIIFLLAVLLVICLPFTVSAVDLNGDGYDDNDFAKLQTFLNLPSSVPDKSNGQQLNALFSPDDPATWTGITWNSAVPKQVTSIAIDGKNLAGALDISGFTALETVDCYGNNLSSLDASGDISLSNMRCYENQLTSLDVSPCPGLDGLVCSDNQLTSLDLSTSTSLSSLICGGNQLTGINLATTSLNALACQDNQLRSLDVSTTFTMQNFICTNNPLISIHLVSSGSDIKLQSKGKGYVELSIPGSESDAIKALPQGGESFSKWTNAGDGSDFSASAVYPITHGATNVNLIANFSGTYAVTFDKNSGDTEASPASAVVSANWTVDAPNPPSRVGYVFSGWYKESACIHVWNLGSDRVTSDMTLYAKWTVATPTGLTAVSAGYSSIRLTWTAVPGVTGYVVYRSTSATGPFATLAACPTTTYTNSGLATGTTYYYSVRAYKATGSTPANIYSSFSNVVSAKPVPAVPVGLAATSISISSIQLTWTAVPGATGYVVYRATSPTGTFSTLAANPTNSFVSNGLATGTTYYYMVRAYTTVGTTNLYSGFSAVASASPVPAVPVGLTAVSASYNSVHLTWTTVPGATGYVIYRSTSPIGTFGTITTNLTTSFINSGLTTGTTYYFKVRAYTTVGSTPIYSGFSTVASATPTGYAQTFKQIIPTGNLWYFYYPIDVAVDQMGNVYCVDFSRNRVLKYNASGKYVMEILGIDADNMFRNINDICVDNNNSLYVVDNYYGVLRFTPDGLFETQIGSIGNNPGQINAPQAVTTDNQNNIYIALYEGWILKFDADGNFIKQWGGSGWNDGQFSIPASMSVDSKNQLYVIDSGNDRVQVFDNEGNFKRKWGTRGQGDGQLYVPYAITIDNHDYVYVSENYNHRISKFSSDGTFITKWGTLGSANDQLNGPQGIAYSPVGNKIYVADHGNHRLLQYSTSGQYLDQWTSVNNPNQFYLSCSDVDVDSSGNIYVPDSRLNCIYKFSPSGTLLKKWGTTGTGNGQFNKPGNLAISPSGYLYVADTDNARIQKFTLDGVYVAKWNLGTPVDKPYRIVVNASNQVYCTAAFNYVYHFSSTGTYLSKWGGTGTTNGKFNGAHGITVDKNGYVYICDVYNRRIQKFSATGTYLAQWSTTVPTSEPLSTPKCITADTSGNLYVTDSSPQVIQFTTTGNYVKSWGQFGYNDNQFNNPEGIALDKSNNIYIADYGNGRIMRLTFYKPAVSNIVVTPATKYGFTSGGTNQFKLECTLTSPSLSTITLTIYNSTEKIVALLSKTSQAAGAVTYIWDGRATAGNTAGLAIGALVPGSSLGSTYKYRISASNMDGSYTDSLVSFKIYSTPAITSISVSPTTFIAEGTNRTRISYKATHMTNLEVRIYGASDGKLYSINLYANVLPGTTLYTYWYGKASAGNTAGLSEGALVPYGNYLVKIVAGPKTYTYATNVHVNR